MLHVALSLPQSKKTDSDEPLTTEAELAYLWSYSVILVVAFFMFFARRGGLPSR
jgi:hypothetical protein